MEDYCVKNFYFDNDITVVSTQDEYGNITPASIDQYKFRSFGLVVFNACPKGTPLIEFIHKIRESQSPTDPTFDPLLSIVITDECEYSVKLYYCHNIGCDYVELASYKDLFADDYARCYEGLCSYRDGNELSVETMQMLKSMLNAAIAYMQDKVAYIRTQ